MIKGHTKIELFNSVTGKKEQEYEKDNLVTNAVQDVIAFHAMTGQTMSSVFPIAEKALGGIMLFDSKLTENINNVCFPSDAKLVGYAGRDTDTSDSMRGSLNALESGPTDTGYVSVWDFGTSQANGTILSVALTSADAGVNPYAKHCGDSYDSEIRTSDDAQKNCKPMFQKDGYLYWLRPDGKTIQRYPFDPYRAWVANFVLGDGSADLETVVELELPDYPYISDKVSGANYLAPNNDGYLYFITLNNRVGSAAYNTYYTSGNSSGDATLYITKYKYADLSFKKQAENIMTLADVHLSTRNESSLVVNGSYLYAKAYDKKGIYIVNLSNAADVKLFTVSNSGTVVAISPMLYNGGIQYQYSYANSGTKYRTGFLYPDGTYSEETIDESAYLIPSVLCRDDKLLAISWKEGTYSKSDSMRVSMKNAYLGTINNLASPISKNASQTMKITYTLTDKTDS
jgi:hypothetical protein